MDLKWIFGLCQLHRPYMPEGMKVAEVIQASFAEIGVKAEIQSVDWATYLDKAAKGEFDAYMLG